MNRNGLELLKQILGGEQNLNELILKDQLPPKFLCFLSLYKVGFQTIFHERIVLNDNDMDEYLLSKITMFEDVEIEGNIYSGSLDYIFSYEKLNEEIEKYRNKVEKWNSLGFMQIGLMHYGDILLLGMNDDRLDEIWRYGQGLTGVLSCKMDDNIFNFMKRLKETILYDDLEDWGVTTKDIYKNIEESFWRVKRVHRSE